MIRNLCKNNYPIFFCKTKIRFRWIFYFQQELNNFFCPKFVHNFFLHFSDRYTKQWKNKEFISSEFWFYLKSSKTRAKKIMLRSSAVVSPLFFGEKRRGGDWQILYSLDWSFEVLVMMIGGFSSTFLNKVTTLIKGYHFYPVCIGFSKKKYLPCPREQHLSLLLPIQKGASFFVVPKRWEMFNKI